VLITGAWAEKMRFSSYIVFIIVCFSLSPSISSFSSPSSFSFSLLSFFFCFSYSYLRLLGVAIPSILSYCPLGMEFHWMAKYCWSERFCWWSCHSYYKWLVIFSFFLFFFFLFLFSFFFFLFLFSYITNRSGSIMR
jgi:hypothetical protein